MWTRTARQGQGPHIHEHRQYCAGPALDTDITGTGTHCYRQVLAAPTCSQTYYYQHSYFWHLDTQAPERGATIGTETVDAATGNGHWH